jgi:hypothetical protein
MQMENPAAEAKLLYEAGAYPGSPVGGAMVVLLRRIVSRMR